jgi:hypothetical protein
MHMHCFDCGWLSYDAANIYVKLSTIKETIWEEVLVAKSKYYPRICLEDLRKTMKPLSRAAGVLTESWTDHLPNKSLQRCPRICTATCSRYTWIFVPSVWKATQFIWADQQLIKSNVNMLQVPCVLPVWMCSVNIGATSTHIRLLIYD